MCSGRFPCLGFRARFGPQLRSAAVFGCVCWAVPAVDLWSLLVSGFNVFNIHTQHQGNRDDPAFNDANYHQWQLPLWDSTIHLEFKKLLGPGEFSYARKSLRPG